MQYLCMIVCVVHLTYKWVQRVRRNAAVVGSTECGNECFRQGFGTALADRIHVQTISAPLIVDDIYGTNEST